jgi:hypothetical protein
MLTEFSDASRASFAIRTIAPADVAFASSMNLFVASTLMSWMRRVSEEGSFD